MSRAHIELDRQAVIAPVRRRAFGSFAEHLGRSAHSGFYEPEHQSAHDDGLGMDVVELALESSLVGLDEFAKRLGSGR